MNEKWDCAGESCSPTFSGCSRAMPACLGNWLLAELVEVDEGRVDILVWVEVELWVEWGMLQVEVKMGGEDISGCCEGSTLR